MKHTEDRININLGSKEDNRKLSEYVAVRTGFATLPLNVLFLGVTQDDERKQLFDMREAMIGNANSILFCLQEIELGLRDPKQEGLAEKLNEALQYWNEYREDLLDGVKERSKHAQQQQ